MMDVEIKLLFTNICIDGMRAVQWEIMSKDVWDQIRCTLDQGYMESDASDECSVARVTWVMCLALICASCLDWVGGWRCVSYIQLPLDPCCLNASLFLGWEKKWVGVKRFEELLSQLIKHDVLFLCSHVSRSDMKQENVERRTFFDPWLYVTRTPNLIIQFLSLLQRNEYISASIKQIAVCHEQSYPVFQIKHEISKAYGNHCHHLRHCHNFPPVADEASQGDTKHKAKEGHLLL